MTGADTSKPRNRQWRLARTPAEGLPTADDFAWQVGALPEPGPEQVLTRTIYLSLDPYQWARRRNGVEQPGSVCHGRTVSQVVRSRRAEWAEGDFLFNTNGWQDYGLTGTGIDVFTYMFPRKLDPALAPISTAVGVLGMLGLTAYAGLMVQCAPRPGETVVVSAASGGVGQIAGQLAKIAGCRVVGIAGAAEKCAFVTDTLGFDACVSHLTEDLAGQLAAACPDGIDVYFENVGGRVFEAVLGLLNERARITLCGMVSQYGKVGGQPPAEAWHATGAPVFEARSVEVHPLMVGNYVASHQAEFLERMAAWVTSGQVKYREDVRDGLEAAPAAFRDMLTGGNFGKTLVAVSEDPTLDAATRAHRLAGNVLG
ncbi:MAG: NADP-dependent oxidoreductase [Pseudomonadales bacterium]